jgi:hypothetical protein
VHVQIQHKLEFFFRSLMDLLLILKLAVRPSATKLYVAFSLNSFY